MTARVDLKISPQDTSWQDFADTVRLAEASGAFTGVWAFDHLSPVASGSPRPVEANSTCLEGWAVLAGMAAITERVRIGLMVTAVPYRPVGVLAKMAATVDQMCSGRLDLGLGAGNTAAEANAFGLRFDTARHRLDDLAAACRLLRASLHRDRSRPPVADAPDLQPAPVQAHVPLILGGKGERRTLPIVAEHADGWNYSRGTPEEFAAKRRVLAELCAEHGRSLDQIDCSVQVRTDFRAPVAGVELATAYIEAGADQIVLYTQADPRGVESLATAAAQLARR